VCRVSISVQVTSRVSQLPRRGAAVSNQGQNRPSKHQKVSLTPLLVGFINGIGPLLKFMARGRGYSRAGGVWQLRLDPRRYVALGETALSLAPSVKQDSRHPFESLDVKMTLGAAQRRAQASGARRFLSGCRCEFPTIGPGQNLSSAQVEP